MDPADLERTVRLPQQTDSPALARRFLAELLERCDRQRWRDSAELALTELVTNAVLHAHSEMIVRARCDGESLRVEVEDFNNHLPVQRSYRPEAATGRGMTLVAALTHGHGVIPTAAGKVVWFTVTDAPLPHEQATGGDLLDAWADLEMPADEPEVANRTTPPSVVLTGFPATLWLAAAQQHDALLRELALYRAGQNLGVEDLAAADRARFSVRTVLERALREARAAGQARSPLPPGHPAALDSVPPVLNLTVPLPHARTADFAVLQDVLDEAQRLAHAGDLLVSPALPEVVAVRDWAAEQVISQLAGQPPRPWPGADVEPAEGSTNAPIDDLDYDTDAILAGERMAILVDGRNRIAGISHHLARDLGYRAAELVGRRVVTIVPPTYREAHIAGFTRHLATGDAHALGVQLQLPVLAADGTEIPYTFFIESDRTLSGRSVYIAWLSAADDRIAR